MLEYDHDGLLVGASAVIALMAGFTGLSLTRGASGLAVGRRKLVVSMAAIALGGGIWAMHFVAMLGIRLPVLFYYDAVITLISALTAILVTLVALLLLHFGPRTQARVAAAGVLIGLGIPAMHFIGMAGMELCRPVYAWPGILATGLVSVGLSVWAVRLAYRRRRTRDILYGTLGFGLTVVTVHFLAMAGTGFVADPQGSAEGPLISNGALALGVTVVAFILSGSFLLTSVSIAAPEAPVDVADAPPRPEPETPRSAAPPAGALRVPYEKDGRTRFVATSQIAAIRAEGHYTLLYVGSERLFCPWSITEAESRLAADPDMIRSHRSYIVNRLHVSSFERKKDSGVCHFDTVSSLGRVPVSRARLAPMRDHLGL